MEIRFVDSNLIKMHNINFMKSCNGLTMREYTKIPTVGLSCVTKALKIYLKFIEAKKVCDLAQSDNSRSGGPFKLSISI